MFYDIRIGAIRRNGTRLEKRWHLVSVAMHSDQVITMKTEVLSRPESLVWKCWSAWVAAAALAIIVLVQQAWIMRQQWRDTLTFASVDTLLTLVTDCRRNPNESEEYAAAIKQYYPRGTRLAGASLHEDIVERARAMALMAIASGSGEVEGGAASGQ